MYLKLLVSILVFSQINCLHDKHLQVSSFSGYQVHRCQAKTRDQLVLLDHLGEDEAVELWTEPSMVTPVDIMTVSGEEDRVLSMLRDNDIPCHTYISDLETLIQEERIMNDGLKKESGDSFNLTIYHDYPEVTYLKIIMALCDIDFPYM